MARPTLRARSPAAGRHPGRGREGRAKHTIVRVVRLDAVWCGRDGERVQVGQRRGGVLVAHDVRLVVVVWSSSSGGKKMAAVSFAVVTGLVARAAQA